jgi:hypothetical protein
MLVLGFVVVAGALAMAPASAEIELPPLPPLPLPTLSPLAPIQEPVTETVNKLLDAPDELLGDSGGSPTGGTVPRTRFPASSPSLNDAWSIDRLPALKGNSVSTEVSSTQLARPGSYASMVSGGLRAAAGRAAYLAGPLAAPLALALFAVGLLAIAARGPRRLVKVDEERQVFRERRSYRL